MTDRNQTLPPVESTPHAHIALQPLFDGQFHHRGDALLYRHSGLADHAEITSPAHATTSAVIMAIYEIGLTQLVGERDLYIKAPAEWLKNADLLPPPDPKLVLEINYNDLTNDLHVLNLVRSGYRLSLFCESWPREDCWPSFETVKIAADTVELSKSRLDVLRALNPELGFIAHRVATREMFELCQSVGFDRFQGYFFAKPMTLKVAGRSNGGNRQVLLSIMQELHSEDVDVQRLSSLMTQLPQATFLLLKRVNSVRESSVRQIESLPDALVRLGLTEIRTLMASLLVVDMGEQARLMLPEILTRAAFCRQLVAKKPSLNPDTAFSVGLFSMLPVVLAMPLESLLAELNVSQEIGGALRSGIGEYGKLLRLVEAFDAAELSPQNRSLIAELNRQYLIARAWSQEVLVNL